MDPLNPQAILDRMAEALPTHEAGDTSSDLSSSLETFALFVHASMTLLEFRLVGFEEDQKMGEYFSTLRTAVLYAPSPPPGPLCTSN